MTVILICAVLTGCSHIFYRDEFVVTPHNETYTSSEDDVTRVGNYASLRSFLLSEIELHDMEAVVHAHNYGESLDNDLSDICEYLINDTAIGAYSVNSISYTKTRFPAYYELVFSINYKRTTDDINSIVTVTNVDDFLETLSTAMTEYRDKVTMQINYFTGKDYDIPTLVDRVYYGKPETSYAFSSYVYTCYPETGASRIVEIEFARTVGSEEITAQKQAVEEKIASILSGGTSPEYLHDALCLAVSYSADDDDGQIFTPYGALVTGKASCQGYALAYKMLCDAVGIECEVVRGKIDGVAHAWNLITVGDKQYHVDVTSDDGSYISHEFFKVSDETIRQTHTIDEDWFEIITQD